MKLLNVGCGGQRPGAPWINLDTLRTQLAPGTPERANLDKEENYVECDLLVQSIPFHDEYFDGILLQHVLEHFTCHEAVDVLLRCRAVLKSGGVLVASVPDADYFLNVYDQDTKQRAIELFGEPIHDAGHDKFFSYALFRYDHKQVLNIGTLDCLLRRSGFKGGTSKNDPMWWVTEGLAEWREINKQLTRRKFSVILCAYK